MATDTPGVPAAAAAIHQLTCRAHELRAACDGPTTRDFELARAAEPHIAAAARAELAAAISPADLRQIAIRLDDDDQVQLQRAVRELADLLDGDDDG